MLGTFSRVLRMVLVLEAESSVMTTGVDVPVLEAVSESGLVGVDDASEDVVVAPRIAHERCTMILVGEVFTGMSPWNDPQYIWERASETQAELVSLKSATGWPSTSGAPAAPLGLCQPPRQDLGYSVSSSALPYLTHPAAYATTKRANNPPPVHFRVP